MRRLLLAPLALALLLFGVSPASATIITYNLDDEFSGGATPSGVPEITLDDFGGIGSGPTDDYLESDRRRDHRRHLSELRR